MLHCGGYPITKEDLFEVPLPQRTATYEPVSHQEIIELVTDKFQNSFDMEVRQERYGVARDGRQMFGVIDFMSEGELGPAVGVRNSYDMSMSVGIASGKNCFVCDNLCFSGDAVTILRKHTKNVHDFLPNAVMEAAAKAVFQLADLSEELNSFREIEVPKQRGYGLIGMMRGNNLITPRQTSRAMEYWVKPPHEEHAEPNLYCWYQAINNALKRSAPSTVMERHFNLHRFAKLVRDGLSELLSEETLW